MGWPSLLPPRMWIVIVGSANAGTLEITSGGTLTGFQGKVGHRPDPYGETSVFTGWFGIAAVLEVIRGVNLQRESSGILAINSRKDRKSGKISFSQLSLE